MNYGKLRIGWSVAALATFVSLIGLFLLDYQRTVIVLLCGIMAATPFARHLTLRFSLRTLFIAVTSVAVGLAVLVYVLKK